MTKTKKSAPKANRSDNLNLRFEPRLKYLAGVAARNERRTLSQLIENAVQEYLEKTFITIFNKKMSVLSMSQELWSVHEADRFVMLAETLEFLLTFEEEQLWAIIQERELATPNRAEELRATFPALRDEALERAANAPIVSVGGFPFRGGKMDNTMPVSLVRPLKSSKAKQRGSGK
jgi:hypothetical protein